MSNLSYCHNKKLIRNSVSGQYVCSSCGLYAVRKNKKKPVPEIIKEKPNIGFPEDKCKFEIYIYPDTRDFIRHLRAPNKYSACGKKGFATTDKKRVNCKNCIKKL